MQSFRTYYTSLRRQLIICTYSRLKTDIIVSFWPVLKVANKIIMILNLVKTLRRGLIDMAQFFFLKQEGIYQLLKGLFQGITAWGDSNTFTVLTTLLKYKDSWLQKSFRIRTVYIWMKNDFLNFEYLNWLQEKESLDFSI